MFDPVPEGEIGIYPTTNPGDTFVELYFPFKKCEIYKSRRLVSKIKVKIFLRGFQSISRELETIWEWEKVEIGISKPTSSCVSE